jgi:hypothetical protein
MRVRYCLHFSVLSTVCYRYVMYGHVVNSMIHPEGATSSRLEREVDVIVKYILSSEFLVLLHWCVCVDVGTVVMY